MVALIERLVNEGAAAVETRPTPTSAASRGLLDLFFDDCMSYISKLRSVIDLSKSKAIHLDNLKLEESRFAHLKQVRHPRIE